MASLLRHKNSWRLILGLFAAMIVLRATSLPAAPINYGNFGPDPPGVTMYLNVTESSATDPIPPGRFGPPELNINVLDFDPTEFAASSTSGASDITDVQLNFTLMAVPNAGITSILVSESGDFTLLGGGTVVTQVAAGLAVQVEILAVDGSPLAVPLNVFASDFFLADLISDGPALVAPWGNSVFVDFAAELVAANIPFNLGVTKAKVVIDDQLIAISEAASVAFIAKKDFRIGPEFEVVPEPASLAMMMFAIAGFGFAFRRRIARSLRERLG